MSYNTCAREIGKCVGLKKGVKGYHKCAKTSNCKKADREKVNVVKKKIVTSRAKKIIGNNVKKLMSKPVIKKLNPKILETQIGNFIDEKEVGGEDKTPYTYMTKRACKQIIELSKLLIESQKNNYKKKITSDFINKASLTIRTGKNYNDTKQYIIPKLESLFKSLNFFISDIKDVKEECGVQEKLFLDKMVSILKTDTPKIKIAIENQRSRHVKGYPINKESYFNKI